MSPQIAITRQVSASIANCELTHLVRTPIDLALARVQHAVYEKTLANLGCRVISLPEMPELPDAVFVEDVALVLDELAIITRPGAASRRQECASIAATLAPYRRVESIQAPGMLDGGDVLRLGRTLYVGQSSRSNPSGAKQLEQLISPHGYAVVPVPVTGCLHLKSAVTQVAADLLLVNPGWVDPSVFRGVACLEIDPGEPYAANALLVGERLIYPAAFPRTRRRLEQAGLTIQHVDVSELAKAEGAVTCCSLIFSTG